MLPMTNWKEECSIGSLTFLVKCLVIAPGIRFTIWPKRYTGSVITASRIRNAILKTESFLLITQLCKDRERSRDMYFLIISIFIISSGISCFICFFVMFPCPPSGGASPHAPYHYNHISSLVLGSVALGSVCLLKVPSLINL